MGIKKEAIICFQKVLEADINSIEGWLWLARMCDQPEARRKCLQAVKRLDPENADALAMQVELDYLDKEREIPVLASMDRPGSEPIPGNLPGPDFLVDHGGPASNRDSIRIT